MVLQALTAYYEQLVQQERLLPPGWDTGCRVSYQLRINEDGDLLDIVDCQETVVRKKSEKLIPRLMTLPARLVKTKGMASNFLCDNARYMLGVAADRKEKESEETYEARKKTAAANFACARALHHKVLDGVDSPVARAILAYFDKWNPADGYGSPILAPHWKKVTGGVNVVISVETKDGNILSTEDPAIKKAWQKHYDLIKSEGKPMIRCIVTGEEAPDAGVHPKIKGVRGAQGSGASLVSFNEDAFCSYGKYGKERTENVQIGSYAAFAYTAALNALLADRNNCRYIGNTTVVCWAENASPSYSSLGMMAMFGNQTGSGVTDEDISKSLENLSKGLPCDFMEDKILPDQKFYILGLDPNGGRISIKFFFENEFGVLAKRIREHNERLAIVKPAFDNRDLLSIWSLANETVNKKAKNAEPVTRLSSDLMKAILNGDRYPAGLINGVYTRIRAEQDVTRGRAAIIKAYYLRNAVSDTEPIPKEVLTMTLNEDSNNLPYVLGRLFAVYQGIQYDSNPHLNRTVKDRFFRSASTQPALAFPQLAKLSQGHLSKLSDGQRIHYERELQSLYAKIGTDFPRTLRQSEQGTFYIGYYHEMQERFAKKNNNNEEKEN